MDSDRRKLILGVAASGVLFSRRVRAQTKLEEKDPQATALGYVHDTAKVDSKKFPKHQKAQQCSNCSLWQSPQTAVWGNCPLFAGKQVNAKGWCSAWIKKS